MDKLVQQLNKLRLEREEAARVYQRSVEASNQREQEIINQIQSRRQTRTEDAQFDRNLRNNKANPLRVGDFVRITNRYVHDEYGTTGDVISASRRMVEIKNRETGRRFTRAWWNLERTEAPSNNAQ